MTGFYGFFFPDIHSETLLQVEINTRILVTEGVHVPIERQSDIKTGFCTRQQGRPHPQTGGKYADFLIA